MKHPKLTFFGLLAFAVGPAGNASGNIAAGPAGNVAGSGNNVSGNSVNNYANGHGGGYSGSGYGHYGCYGSGCAWGAYAAGVATGSAAAASSDRSSTTYYSYGSPYYYYTCWDVSNLSDSYAAASAGAAVVDGHTETEMKNQNGVVIKLHGTTEGVDLRLSVDGVSLKLTQ